MVNGMPNDTRLVAKTPHLDGVEALAQTVEVFAEVLSAVMTVVCPQEAAVLMLIQQGEFTCRRQCCIELVCESR